MLLIRNLLAINVLLIGVGSYSQDASKVSTNNEGLSLTEMQTAIDQYVIMFNSETYRSYLKKSIDFNQLMNNQNAEWSSSDNKVFDAWLLINLDKTKFKSSEEAKFLKESLVLAMKRVIENNKSLYLLMAKATVEQLIRVLKPYTDYIEDGNYKRLE